MPNPADSYHYYLNLSPLAYTQNGLTVSNSPL